MIIEPRRVNLLNRSISTAPTELPAVPGGWAERLLTLAGRRFRLAVPATPDAFLDDPRVLAEHERSGYMPYWGYLWPTSLEMAAAILTHPWQGTEEVLEVGSGLGLVGIAALAAGLRVTFSDYDAEAVDVALFNARQNGFSDAAGLVFDWGAPLARQFDIVLACEVIYEERNHAPLLKLLHAMLAPGGEAWFADPGRHQAPDFVAAAPAAGFTVAHQRLPREPFPGRPDGVTDLWRVTHAAGSTGGTP